MKFVTSLILVLLLTVTANTIRAELPIKRVLTLNVAKKIAEAADTEATKRGATVVIAVVDDGGHLILLERLDNTQVASVEVAIGKARTAAIFRRPSKVFEDQIRDGRVAALALPGATPLQGGIPITVDGKVVMRYEVNADGTLSNGKVFFDMTNAQGEDALDGMKIDQKGNLYVSGPGGLWILSPEGKHLGTIIDPMHPHNMAWGDEDGKTLYMTARTGLYSIRLNIPGIRP